MKQLHAGKLIPLPLRASALERRDDNEALSGDILAFDRLTTGQPHANMRFVRFYLHRFFRTLHPHVCRDQIELVLQCLQPLVEVGSADWRSRHIDAFVGLIEDNVWYDGLPEVFGAKPAKRLERWIKLRYTWLQGGVFESGPRQKAERDFLIRLTLLLAVFVLTPADVSNLPKENVR